MARYGQAYKDRIVARLLPPCDNEYRDVSLPAPMNMVMHRLRRPALCVYATRNATLLAGPGGYQLWRGDENWFWPSASPRVFSKLVRSVLDLAVNLRIDGSATTEMHRDRETECREEVCG